MSRGPMRFKQSDLLRAVKVAQKSGGAWDVVIDPDGSIRLAAPKEGQDRPQDGGGFADRPPMVF